MCNMQKSSQVPSSGRYTRPRTMFEYRQVEPEQELST